MKRASVVLVCLLFAAWLTLPIPKAGEHGATNVLTGWMYCDVRWACLHEIGHVLDIRGGYISQTKAFSRAVELYVLVNARIDHELPPLILAMTYTAPDNQEPTKMELYAFLFEYSNGDPSRLPESLRPFFDWHEGQRLIEERIPHE